MEYVSITSAKRKGTVLGSIADRNNLKRLMNQFCNKYGEIALLNIVEDILCTSATKNEISEIVQRMNKKKSKFADSDLTNLSPIGQKLGSKKALLDLDD